MIKFVSLPFLFANLLFSVNCLAQSSPKNLFIHHCIGCHAIDGSGAPEVGVPSMNGLLGKFLQIPGGREYIVQVPGVMNSPLNDAEVARLMNWLVFAMGPKPNRDFSPYETSEIKSLRQNIPENIGAVRAKLIKLIETD
jgi:mono/diheme cytochrome c family protein